MDGWASVKKAAKYADISERTMRDWLKNGLKHSKPSSGMIRIPGSGRKFGGIEMYDKGRYFTVTGKVLDIRH